MSLLESLETRRHFSAQFDPAFGGDGIVNQLLGDGDFHITATAVQSGGRLLVAGTHTAVGKSGTLPFLYRFKANGLLDDRFSGMSTISAVGRGTPEQLLIEPDGRVAVKFGGDTTGQTMFGLTVSGKLDSGFTRVPTSLADSTNATVQTNGKILLASANSDGFTIHRLNSNGTLDTSFNDTGTISSSLGFSLDANHQVSLDSLTVTSDGEIYAGGRYSDFSGSTENDALVARFTAAGVLDTSFAGDGVYQFGVDQPALSGTNTTSMIPTVDGGVVALIRRTDPLGTQAFALSASGVATATPATLNDANAELFASSDGSYLINNQRFISRYTASNKYDARFGHLFQGAAPHSYAISSDGTLYTAGLSGQSVGGGKLRFTLNLERQFVQTGPVGLLNIGALTAAPAGSYVFTVQYRDVDGVQRASLGNDDLELQLPDGTLTRVVFVKSDTTTDAKVIDATYKIPPIGGRFDAGDNGLYAIQLIAKRVENVDQQFFAAQTLGYFKIDVA